jgi:hypothetical protein
MKYILDVRANWEKMSRPMVCILSLSLSHSLSFLSLPGLSGHRRGFGMCAQVLASQKAHPFYRPIKACFHRLSRVQCQSVLKTLPV